MYDQLLTALMLVIPPIVMLAWIGAVYAVYWCIVNVRRNNKRLDELEKKMRK